MVSDFERHRLHHQPNDASSNYVERCCNGHKETGPRRWFDSSRATGLVSKFADASLLAVRKPGLKAD